MKPRAIHTTAANGPNRRRTSADTNDTHSQTIRQLRVAIGLLSALVLASGAHAVIDGLTTGLAVGLALTILLLLALLGLWRIGSTRRPDGGPAPPGLER
jgi:hypothetical protein